MDEPFVCIGHYCSYTSTNSERSSSKLTFKIMPHLLMDPGTICMHKIMTRTPLIFVFQRPASGMRKIWVIALNFTHIYLLAIFNILNHFSHSLGTPNSKLLVRVYCCRISMGAEWREGSEKLHFYIFRLWKSRNKRRKKRENASRGVKNGPTAWIYWSFE